MRLTSENLLKTFTYSMAVGFGTLSEVELALDSDEAIIPKSLFVEIDPASASPSVTGAGLTAFWLAITSKDQSTPSGSILQLERLIHLLGFSQGSTAAGAVNLRPPDRLELFQSRLCREIHALGYTNNITNAATTVLRCVLLYDRYTITSAEKVQLL